MEVALNGLNLNNINLPLEVLIEIFRRSDRNSLLNSQFVCKSWHDIIKKYIWHRDAKIVFKQRLPFDNDTPWIVYYIMSRIIFGCNLIRNHSGAHGFSYWLSYNSSAPVLLENVAWPTPKLPNDPVFEGKNDYFHCDYYFKCQTIDLTGAGYSSTFLDIMQPPIEVSVWFTGVSYLSYQVGMYLCNKKNVLLCKYEYLSLPLEWLPHEWHKVTFTFENYGPGAALVRFSDTGSIWWKVAGINVKVLPPETLPINFQKAIMDLPRNIKKWHKKAEYVFQQKIPLKIDIPCNIYYIMSRTIFEYNLIKNHSGEDGYRYWRSGAEGCCSTWNCKLCDENDLDFPKSSDFDGQEQYFVCGFCPRFQDINLQDSGYSAEFLDIMQPPIEISVWFACNVNALYRCWAYYFKSTIPTKTEFSGIQTKSSSDKWRKVHHVFENYGPGLTAIRFIDCGTHSQCKVAGVSVKVLRPKTIPVDFEKAFL